MTQMVERVAMEVALASHHTWGNLTESIKNRFRTQAKAAIQAMRDPTEAMLQEGAHGTQKDISSDALRTTWVAMIDAALR